MTRLVELACLVACGVCAVLLSPWWAIGVTITLAYILRMEWLSLPDDGGDNAAIGDDADRDDADVDERERDRA